jgi:hypothetical protein
MRNRLKMMKMKIKRMSHLKGRTMIKGEMIMLKTRKMIKKFSVKDHHTPRVHQAIQRDHPVNSILGDIHKGVPNGYSATSKMSMVW